MKNEQIEINSHNVDVYRQDLGDMVFCSIDALKSFATIIGMLDDSTNGVPVDRVEDVFEVLHQQAKMELKTLADAIEKKLGGPIECIRAAREARKIGIREDDVLAIEVKMEQREEAAA